MNNNFTFIDLFAGIGGFHLAMHELGGECVFASEIDKDARKTYEHNFTKLSPKLFESGLYNDDIRSFSPQEIPDFDVLCAGFPCQPFSQAGYKRGFDDTSNSERGNLFFNIVDILEAKKPKAFFLENVRGIVNHDGGKTFKTIRSILEDELGYSFYFEVVKASDYGLPQLRPRTFMIGFRDDSFMGNFTFPAKKPLKFNMSDVWGGECSREIGFTLRVGGRGSKITDRRNWDSYLVDGEVKRLMPEQGRKMQGFPDGFEFPVSKVSAMKQLGNSVAVDAIYECGKSLVQYMNQLSSKENNMSNKSNKGEWTELYSFIQLIHDKHLYLANKDLEPLENGRLSVTKVKTKNSKNECILTEWDQVLVRDLESGEVQRINVTDLINEETIQLLSSRIKSGKGASFEISEFEVIKSSLGIHATKGGSSKQKADIILDIQNEDIQKENEGFGIKSYLGNKPTLLNASGSNTNFIFKIEGVGSLDFEEINKINTGQKIKKRLFAILEAGGKLVFDRVEAQTMEHNLKMIDTSMCHILSEMLLKFYVDRVSSVKDSVKIIHNESNFKKQINYGDEEHLEVIVKRLLLGVMLGFFTGEKWDGHYTSNGTIVVKDDGSQVGFHIIDKKNMENYLFECIKFDTPSTTRHRFASVIKENGSYYFKLNLQLRF